MRIVPFVFVPVCLAATLSTTSAYADDSTALKAAGFAIIGIGGALGAGSIITGALLSDPNNNSDEQRLANATWIGGAVTVGVSLAIGLPLVLSSSPRESKTAAIVDAFSGRVRF